MNVPVPDPLALWWWLPVGYAITVALEAPVLMAGLGHTSADHFAALGQSARRAARRYTVRQRLAAAVWLTAVTYPVVAVALPLLLWPRATYGTYLVVAEAFAIVVECVLFRTVWHGTRRDLGVIALANVLSASVGWYLFARG